MWKPIIESYGISPDLWKNNVFPPIEDVYNALCADLCKDPGTVRVVILGQDPYPTRGNAPGLAFSVRSGVAIPAFLKNINK